MTNTLATRVAAAMGFLAVALGAFGAHGLKQVLEQNQTLETWKTAALYHLAHAVMLVMLALRRPLLRGPWVSFLIGIVIFSGSLYVLAVTNLKWLGAIAPVGGLSLMVGWGWLMVAGDGKQET